MIGQSKSIAFFCRKTFHPAPRVKLFCEKLQKTKTKVYELHEKGALQDLILRYSFVEKLQKHLEFLVKNYTCALNFIY